MIGRDKIYHLLAGIIISVLVLISCEYFNVASEWELYAIGTATLAGILKEFYDKYIKKTYFSFDDAIVTFAGGIIGTIYLVRPILLLIIVILLVIYGIWFKKINNKIKTKVNKL